MSLNLERKLLEEKQEWKDKGKKKKEVSPAVCATEHTSLPRLFPSFFKCVIGVSCC